RLRLSPVPGLTVSNRIAPGAAFQHGTFEKSARSQGAGLVLAIVARVAAAQGIKVDYAMGRDRASVSLRFPEAGDAGSAVIAE
ncbi:MAG: hypothetical protein ACU0DM_11055, partial [Paracoccus sp. (in: a-proteobacteria)]